MPTARLTAAYGFHWVFTAFQFSRFHQLLDCALHSTVLGVWVRATPYFGAPLSGLVIGNRAMHLIPLGLGTLKCELHPACRAILVGVQPSGCPWTTRPE